MFRGNSDRHSIVSYTLFKPFTAQYVRIHPKGWRSHISMRAELYGCQKGTNSMLKGCYLSVIFCWTHLTYKMLHQITVAPIKYTYYFSIGYRYISSNAAQAGKINTKGGPISIPNTRYHLYWGFLENIDTCEKYRIFRSLSILFTWPFTCFSAENQYFSVCVCAVALSMKEVSQG